MRPQVQAVAAWALAGLLLLAVAPAKAEESPLAPAEAGKLGCFKPNADQKTCWVLANFKKQDDGHYEAAVKSRFSNTTDYESRFKQTMALKDGKLCYIFEKASYEQARFFHLGDEVINQDLEMLRNQVINQLQNEFGKEYCSTFGPADAKGVIALTNSVNGEVQLPGTSIETFAWVSPEDGYKLRAPSK